MNTDIENINIILKTPDEDTLITNVVNYCKKNNVNPSILEDTRILLNHSRRSYLLSTINQLLNDNIDNYKIYVSTIKNVIKKTVNSFYEDINDFLTDDELINKQIKNIIDNLPIISLNKEQHYSFEDIEELKYDYNRKLKYRRYKLTKTKYFDNLIFYSYLCYFKAAVNCIIHHPFYDTITNTTSLTPTSLTPTSLTGGYDITQFTHPYEIFMIGGNDLWNTLNGDLMDIVKTYNKLTRNNHFIGTPGIKYYPHQILNELLFYLNNSFSFIFRNKTTFVININDNSLANNKPKHINPNKKIADYFKHFNKESMFFSTVHNDPFESNTFTYITTNYISYNDIKQLNNTMRNKAIELNHIYQYNYIIDNYYLQSFCVIENIPSHNMDFHCIYIKLLYDEDYNVVDKIRYDDKKLHYNEETMNIYKYMRTEMNIFRDNCISDYFDKSNYKICLVCYVKK